MRKQNNKKNIWRRSKKILSKMHATPENKIWITIEELIQIVEEHNKKLYRRKKNERFKTKNSFKLVCIWRVRIIFDLVGKDTYHSYLEMMEG